MSVIREAKGSDLTACINLAEMFFAEYHKGDDIDFSVDAIAVHFSLCVSRADRCLLVFDNNGIHGMLTGRVQPVEWCDALEGTHDYLYVKPSSRGNRAGGLLAKAFYRWVKDFGKAQQKPIWNVAMGFRLTVDEEIIDYALRDTPFKKSGVIYNTR